MTTSRSISNAVLQERIDQQHVQVMLSLAQLTDKITTLCQRMQGTEIARAEDRARIAAIETQHKTMRVDLDSVKARTLRLIIAVAVLSGATSVAVDKLVGLFTP